MATSKDFIIEQIKKQIADFKTEAKEQTVGRVLKVSDGIALISGLADVMMSEILMFKSGDKEIAGVALNLQPVRLHMRQVGAHEETHIVSVLRQPGPVITANGSRAHDGDAGMFGESGGCSGGSRN